MNVEDNYFFHLFLDLHITAKAFIESLEAPPNFGEGTQSKFTKTLAIVIFGHGCDYDLDALSQRTNTINKLSSVSTNNTFHF